MSCAVAEQSVLYRKIPTRSDTSAAARSPPPFQPLSYTHFNLKSQPEVPRVLKSLLWWHPASPGPSALHFPGTLPVPAGCLEHPWERQERERLSARTANPPGLTLVPSLSCCCCLCLSSDSRSGRRKIELFSQCLQFPRGGSAPQTVLQPAG